MRIVLSLILMASLGACSEAGTKSYQLYDSNAYAYFLRALDSSGIAYSQEENWTIKYSASQHDKVMVEVDKVMAHYYSDCGGSFQDARKQGALKKRLRRKQIPFRAVTMDEGEKLLCDPSHTEKFNNVYRSVLRRYR